MPEDDNKASGSGYRPTPRSKGDNDESGSDSDDSKCLISSDDDEDIDQNEDEDVSGFRQPDEGKAKEKNVRKNFILISHFIIIFNKIPDIFLDDRPRK